MTFELSSSQQEARDRARAFAQEQIEPRAAEIDQSGRLPPELARAAAALLRAAPDGLARVLVIEALAVASGATALVAAAESSTATTPLELPGLRGAQVRNDGSGMQLALAGVALGLGTSAVRHAVAALRDAAAHPGPDGEKPHWVLADAATELEAARLLTYRAAHAEGDTAQVAMARLMAALAAQRAVDAALRITGAGGFETGSLLDRLSRDVRAAALVMGTEEAQRAEVARGVLPQ